MAEPQKETSDEVWAERAQQALERRWRMESFGPNVRGLYVETGAGFFVLDPEDGHISAELLNSGTYNESEYRVLQSIVTKDSDVLVVGAHIGTHAVRLAKHCRSLVAVEASPRNFRFLRTNILLNECANMTAYNIAASDKPEKIKFLLNTENSGGSKRVPQILHKGYIYDKPDIVEVDAMPLDVLLGSQSFEFILIDTEGSEYFALKGMQRILAEAKTLQIEFMTHLVKTVATVGPEDFLALLLPHFQWMCVPRHNRVYPQHEIAGKLKAIYDANENHEGIFFLKDPLPEWLLRRQR